MPTPNDSPRKPAIVIVPGAWHIPEHFAAFTPHLLDAGYNVKVLHMPSTSDGKKPAVGPAADVEMVRKTVLEFAEHGENVLLVAHSLGGVAATEACQGYTVQDRERDGKKGGVMGISYMAAWVPEIGKSVADYYETEFGVKFAEVYDFQGVDNMHTPVYNTVGTTPNFLFYHDLPTSQSDHAESLLQLQARASFEAVATYPVWKQLPSTYLICEDDHAIPLALQEKFSSWEGGKWTVETMNCGHSCFMRFSEETAKAIRRAAGEEGV